MDSSESLMPTNHQPEVESSADFQLIFNNRLAQAPLLSKERGLQLAQQYDKLGVIKVKKHMPAQIFESALPGRKGYDLWLHDPQVEVRKNAPHQISKEEFYDFSRKKWPGIIFFPKSAAITIGEIVRDGQPTEIRILATEEAFFDSISQQLETSLDKDLLQDLKDLIKRYNINAIVGKPKGDIKIHPAIQELSKNIPVFESAESAEERRRGIVLRKIAMEYKLTAIEYLKFLTLCRAEHEAGNARTRDYCTLAQQIVAQRDELPQPRILKKTYQFQLPEDELHNDSLNEPADNRKVKAIIAPSGLELNEQNKSNILFVSELAEEEDTLDNTLLALARKGYEVFAPLNTEKSLLRKKYDSLPLAERQKTFALLSILDQENIKEGVIVTTSLGSASGLYAAYLDSLRKPEDRRIKKTILINPAGIAKRSILSLIFASRDDLAEEKSRLSEESLLYKNILKHQQTSENKLKNHPLKAYSELSSKAKTDVRYLLKRLIDADMKISIICSRNDALFPVEKIRKRLEELEIRNINLVEAEGSHYNFLANPAAIMSLVDREISG